MCSTLVKYRSKLPLTFLLYLVMVALGILAGISDIYWLQKTGLLISDLFVNMFKFISMPVISLSIIVTLIHYTSEGGMNSVWRKTMQYTFLTTFIAACLSCVIYLLVQPSMAGPINTGTAPSDLPIKTETGYLGYLGMVVPSNILSPFLEHQVMAVLLLSVVFGFAIRNIPNADSRQLVTDIFTGIHQMFLVITRWLVMIIPIGLFGFITATVLHFKEGMDIHGIGEYLLVVLLANCIQGLVIIPIWLKMRGIRPFVAMRAMLPALSVAFFSKSSVGTLPVTMNTIEKNLQVKPEISRFVLPLCTSINMNGCAAFIFVTSIYLMQNHGITVTLPMMGLWIFISTLAALGNAGVPMGCFFLSASLMVSMNVPITLLGIILPFYTLIDMLETALNVWSDISVTKVVNDQFEDAVEDRELVV